MRYEPVRFIFCFVRSGLAILVVCHVATAKTHTQKHCTDEAAMMTLCEFLCIQYKFSQIYLIFVARVKSNGNTVRNLSRPQCVSALFLLTRHIQSEWECYEYDCFFSPFNFPTLRPNGWYFDNKICNAQVTKEEEEEENRHRKIVRITDVSTFIFIHILIWNIWNWTFNECSLFCLQI